MDAPLQGSHWSFIDAAEVRKDFSCCAQSASGSARSISQARIASGPARPETFLQQATAFGQLSGSTPDAGVGAGATGEGGAGRELRELAATHVANSAPMTTRNVIPTPMTIGAIIVIPKIRPTVLSAFSWTWMCP